MLYQFGITKKRNFQLHAPYRHRVRKKKKKKLRRLIITVIMIVQETNTSTTMDNLQLAQDCIEMYRWFRYYA